MKLREWIRGKGLSLREVAEGINALLPPGETISVSGIEKWMSGVRTPRRSKMLALTTFTNSEVTANDFADMDNRGGCLESHAPSLRKAS